MYSVDELRLKQRASAGATAKKKREKTAKRIRQALRKLQARGETITQEAIARQAKISVRTVQRHWHLAGIANDVTKHSANVVSVGEDTYCRLAESGNTARDKHPQDQEFGKPATVLPFFLPPKGGIEREGITTENVSGKKNEVLGVPSLSETSSEYKNEILSGTASFVDTLSDGQSESSACESNRTNSPRQPIRMAALFEYPIHSSPSIFDPISTEAFEAILPFGPPPLPNCLYPTEPDWWRKGQAKLARLVRNNEKREAEAERRKFVLYGAMNAQQRQILFDQLYWQRLKEFSKTLEDRDKTARLLEYYYSLCVEQNPRHAYSRNKAYLWKARIEADIKSARYELFLDFILQGFEERKFRDGNGKIAGRFHSMKKVPLPEIIASPAALKCHDVKLDASGLSFNGRFCGLREWNYSKHIEKYLGKAFTPEEYRGAIAQKRFIDTFILPGLVMRLDSSDRNAIRYGDKKKVVKVINEGVDRGHLPRGWAEDPETWQVIPLLDGYHCGDPSEHWKKLHDQENERIDPEPATQPEEAVELQSVREHEERFDPTKLGSLVDERIRDMVPDDGGAPPDNEQSSDGNEESGDDLKVTKRGVEELLPPYARTKAQLDKLLQQMDEEDNGQFEKPWQSTINRFEADARSSVSSELEDESNKTNSQQDSLGIPSR
jgi:hypothetical protein